MKRKVIALLLASTMVLSMTACGGSGGDSGESTSGSTASSEGGGSGDNTLTV